MSGGTNPVSNENPLPQSGLADLPISIDLHVSSAPPAKAIPRTSSRPQQDIAICRFQTTQTTKHTTTNSQVSSFFLN